jgi:FkbM family methyltransferase
MFRRRFTAANRAFREAAYASPRELSQSLALLGSELEDSPVVVDVGANVGAWTKSFLAARPGARVVMVEAQPERMSQLARLTSTHPNVTAHNAVLASAEGEQTFYVCHGDVHRSGSSLMPELTGERLESRVVATQTLDALLRSLSLPAPPQYVKLDTQGTELEILAGASDALASAEFLQLEVSLIRYNEGAPLAAEVFAFLADHGFFVRDIFDVKYQQSGDLSQVDCIFSRRLRTVSEFTLR